MFDVKYAAKLQKKMQSAKKICIIGKKAVSLSLNIKNVKYGKHLLVRIF